MPSTLFQDFNQNTPITSTWLNDVNKVTYSPTGVPKSATQSAAAWVRFSVTGGIVSIQQSSNVSTVTRTATGVYQIVYGSSLTNADNVYSLSMGQAGFLVPSAELVNGVTISTFNTADAAVDPVFVTLVVFGNN